MTNKQEIEALFKQLLAKGTLKEMMDYTRALYKEPLSWETWEDYEKYGDMFVGAEPKADVQKHSLAVLDKKK